MAAFVHVVGDRRPEQRDHRPAAMFRVHAGPPRLDQLAADARQAREVELGVGVKAPGFARALGRKQPVGADDLLRGVLAHDQVVAVRVERIDVEAAVAAWQARAHFLREHAMAQCLRLDHFTAGLRERDLESRGRVAGRDARLSLHGCPRRVESRAQRNRAG